MLVRYLSSSECDYFAFSVGGELYSKLLDEYKLSEAKARKYFQQLIDGLSACHEKGVRPYFRL